MSYLAFFGKGITFEGIDGNTYEVTPLTLQELADFVAWVQYKPYRDALAADLSKDICDKILAECKTGLVIERVPSKEWIESQTTESEEICPPDQLVEEKFPISLESTVVRRAMLSPDGLHKLFHLSLLPKHPELRGKSLNSIINLPKFRELQNELLKVNGLLPDEDEDSEEEEEKNEISPNTTNM